MPRKHLTVAIVLAAILMMALTYVGWKYGRPDYDPSDPTQYMILEPGVGITSEWADPTIDRANPPADVDTSKIVYEAYKVFDQSGGYPEVGGVDGNVNISQENARVFLTYPDGSEEEITSELWYVPLQIYPPLAGGEYALRFELQDGNTFARTILLPDAIEVSLTPTGETRFETVPEGPRAAWSPSEWHRYNEIESLPRHERTLHAFRFGDLDLENTENALHILPSNTVRGGEGEARKFARIDEFFWLDLHLWGANPHGDHLFLVKDEGQWYYAAVTMPSLMEAAGVDPFVYPSDEEILAEDGITLPPVLDTVEEEEL